MCLNCDVPTLDKCPTSKPWHGTKDEANQMLDASGLKATFATLVHTTANHLKLKNPG